MLMPSKDSKSDTLILLVWLALFCLGFWYLDQHVYKLELAGLKSLEIKLIGYVLYAFLLSIPYAFLLKRPRLHTNWYVGAILVALTTVLSPTVLQTDQIRYIWDGAVSLRAGNPYLHAPIDHPDFSIFSGNQLLNHNTLPTIYPPVAQWAFAVSGLFNPFLWNGTLGWTAAPLLEATQGFKLELGWKIICGVFAFLAIYLNRNKRWDLFFLHPLILMTWVGNAHIDALLMVCIFLVLCNSNRPWKTWIFLSLGIAAKWVPILFLPHFIMKICPQKSLKSFFQFILPIAIIVVLPVVLYSIDSNGNFFTSIFIYARNWSFFGAIHPQPKETPATQNSYSGSVFRIFITK